MNEPRRWLDGDAPGGITELLRAGLEERPNRKTLQRTMLAVGITAMASSTAVTAIGATAKLVLVAKAATISVVTATVILSAAAGVEHYRTSTSTMPALGARGGELPAASAAKQRVGASTTEIAMPSASPTLIATKTTVSNPSATSFSTGATRSSIIAESVPIPRALTGTERPAGATAGAIATRDTALAVLPGSGVEPAGPSPTTAPMFAPPTVSEEIAVIDAARARLRSGDAEGALRHANEYERRPGFGRFAPEALYLRMEAQLRLGNRPAAKAAARELVTRFPRAAHVRRAAEVLESSGGEQIL